jgi:CheY-like chemotaxis protein
LITNILEKGKESTIYTLKMEPGEFGYIGNLFEENNNQQKQLEISKKRAEESDKLKSSFLANLSHEIRTPMNAIVGFSDLLANPDLSEKDKTEFLKIIKDSGNSLVSIIEDLIEMSKIDANQITPNYRGINIEKCMEELYTTLKVTIPADKNIDFYIIKNEEKITNEILTDEIKLKQIFVNLITNAIKFTNTGHVAFGYNVNHQKNVIEFRVEDSGVGINEGNLDLIFDRFRRIEDDFTIEFCGLGLGLSISKAYVEMLGGTIDVKSTIGIGSVFVFEIPLIYQKSTGIDDTVHSSLFFEDTGSKTILIAEDDNINFLLLKKILELKNYTVLRARNGQEAVNMCKENLTIDVVFMDIKMPVLGGFEAFETVKNYRPELPVIAQTAYSSSEDREKIINSGFAAYITKPLDKTKIFEILDRIFSKRV